MVSGDGHWICTSYSKVDGVNVYEREIQIARVYGETSNTIESILAMCVAFAYHFANGDT